jgi:hypothetical protein
VVDINWGECYYDHYARFFGEPAQRARYEPGPGVPNIQILVYANVFPDASVCCSLGLTQYEPDIGRTAEVVLVADTSVDEAAHVLGGALTHLVTHRIELGWGTRLTGLQQINPDFAARYDKPAIYFTYQYVLPEAFSDVVCQGQQGLVFQALLISQREFEYIRDRGVEAFEAHWERYHVDPIRLGRPSSV